jgi:hypothetical protein
MMLSECVMMMVCAVMILITVVQQHLSTTERAKYGIVAGLATMQSQSHHGGAAASVLNEEKT